MSERHESGRLVVVSNRLPIQTVAAEGGGVKLQAGGGGLVAALRFVLQGRGGLWIGWPGEGDLSGFEERAHDLPFPVVPVPLAREEVEGHYDGLTNRTLWPLFHDLVGRTVFEHSWWEQYVAVNRKFAKVVVARSSPEDLIWVQDFHLLLLGEMIRRERPAQRIGFFLHTPFPPVALFQRLPWAAEIIRGMLGCDAVGFQTERDLGAFARSVLALHPEARPLDFTERQAVWEWEGRTVQAGVFPISIDFAHWDSLARSKAVKRKSERFREKVGHRKIILGVDRLDYSKGIPQRVRAFGLLLERHPEERERVQFLQIAVPSRTSVSEYKELKREIDRLIGNINGKFGTPGWVPVNYLYRSFDPADLAAYYRASDVALVTPIKDGMNLVAKEFAAASVEKTGVLVLSEFAGAAYELEVGAIVVNPHDTVEVAEAMHQALHMGAEEQRARLDALRSTIAKHDVHAWSRAFLDVAAGTEEKVRTPPEIMEAWPGWRAPRLLLHIDYDGVLVPSHPHPGMAIPPADLVTAVDRLALGDGLTVVISSGRALSELSGWFPNPALILIGGHGASWRHGGVEGPLLVDCAQAAMVAEARELLGPIVDEAPGAFLEDKGLSLAVHYRMVAEFVLPRLLPMLRKTLERFVAGHPGLTLMGGRCVIELLPRGVECASAFHRVRALLGRDGDPVAAFASDPARETLFERLREDDLSVHVGGGPTTARFVLRRPNEVVALLGALAPVRSGVVRGA